MAEQEDGHGAVPPEGGDAREHPFPAATIWPAGFAAGIAILLVGVVFSWVVFGIGVAIAAVFGVVWAADVFRGPRPAQPVPPAEPEEPAAEDGERFGRDKFLELSTLGLGALIGGVVTVPVVGFAIAPSFVGQDDEDVELGPLENFPETTWVVATFRSRKGQGDVSRQTAYIRNNGVRDGVPSFTILSNHCVHLGCPVQAGGLPQEATEVETEGGPVSLFVVQGTSGFICPCHGGSYDTEGNRTAGPPVRALDRYRFKIVNGSLVVGERYSVGKVLGTGADAKIEAYTRYDPGQHVDGPTEWLYPVSPRGV